MSTIKLNHNPKFQLPLRYAPFMKQSNICTYCRKNALLKDIIDTTCQYCINNYHDDLPLLDYDYIDNNNDDNDDNDDNDVNDDDDNNDD